MNNITFKEFTKDFFLKETCPINKRRVIRRKNMSHSYITRLRFVLVKKLWPYWEDSIISDITQHDLESFIDDILINKKCSMSFVNLIITCFNFIFREANRVEIIKTNPMNHIKRTKPQPKEKGFLNSAEIKLFFNRDDWNSARHYYLHKIAMYAGLRLGEILSLTEKDLIREDGCYYFYITKTYNPDEGIKPPKFNKIRVVPIPDWFAKKLKKELRNKGFWFSTNGITPYHYKTCYFHFTKHLEMIGVDHNERLKRNITIHSWRHRYISLLNGVISPAQLRLIVGHSKQQVTDIYTHQIISKTQKVLSNKFFEDIYDN